MIGIQEHNQILAVKEFSFDKNQTVNRILLLVKDNFPEFGNLLRHSGVGIKKEDDISKELLRFLNDRARSENLLFQFNEKKGVDFTIFAYPFKMGASSIFMIEAKRLSKSHYDYVSGRTGGIERIKREQDEFGKHLNLGAMIGYIQDENHEFWEKRINAWIDDLINKDTDIVWNSNDRLIPNTELSDYISVHWRISYVPITLHHYWIALN